jgi:hypothetical protein
MARTNSPEPVPAPTPKEPAVDRLYTPEELCLRWGGAVRPRTLKKWRIAKRGPGYVRIGNRVLYRAAEVLAWELAQVVASQGGDAPAVSPPKTLRGRGVPR